MNEAQVLEIARDTVLTLVLVSAPVLLVGMAIGLVISLFQTLTQIQEMTLTFVPKVAAMLAVFWVSMSFMTATLVSFFTQRIIPLIAGS